MPYYLALDIGGSAIKYAVMDQDMKIVIKDNYPSPTESIQDFWQAFEQHLLPLLSQYSIKEVAISAPGSVDCDSSIIYGHSALRYLHGPNFRQEMQQRYQLSCEIENDANCAALGELWHSKDQSDFCLLVIGSGVGGAIVIDGKIHHGCHLHGAEFGYMLIDKDEKGKPISFSHCGSTRALVQQAAKHLSIDESELNGKQVFELAENGQNELNKVIQAWYQKLALGIYNVQYCIDPQRIIIGGAISSRPDLVENIEKHLNQILQDNPYSSVMPKLSVCQAGNDANLIGAMVHMKQTNK